jgi:hypothetical protein
MSDENKICVHIVKFMFLRKYESQWITHTVTRPKKSAMKHHLKVSQNNEPKWQNEIWGFHGSQDVLYVLGYDTR